MSITKAFITDCEGPISRNDNAYELTGQFVPNGDYLFAIISRYDDVQADIVRREGYKAGDTLKLILPFLKAYQVTNKDIKKFSAENILLMPHAKDTLQFIKDIMISFIVSTSYEQYMQALCDVLDFPFENVNCTRLDIDKYHLGKSEIEQLKQLRKEIVAIPMIQIPEKATTLEDFSEKDKKTIYRLDEIFWKEISEMRCARILKEVNPVGGSEKAKAVQEIIAKKGVQTSDVMYVGDSITDIQSFRLVREKGGLTTSFNGNNYAVREAEIAVLSNNTTIIAVFADVFSRFGRKGVLELVEKWGFSMLDKYCSPILQDRISRLYSETLPKVEIVTAANRERLMEESTAFRKTVRGKAVGGLG